MADRSKIAIALLLSLLSIASFTRCASTAVAFRTADGFQLEAREFGSGPKAVVLAPMSTSDMDSWGKFARVLAKEGYHVVTFNFRGYGESEGRKDFDVMDRDVAAAAAHMRGKGASRVALIGASMGGTASLVASAGTKNAVATLSAPMSFRGLDASSILPSVSGPKLFVASVDDRPAASDAKEMFRLAGDPTADLQLLPGDAHGLDMLESGVGEEATDMILDFLQRFHV